MLAILLLLAALPPDVWALRTSRLEGAALNVGESAAAVRGTAEGIVAAGQLRDVAKLRSEADELQRRVRSLLLAAEQLDQAD